MFVYQLVEELARQLSHSGAKGVVTMVPLLGSVRSALDLDQDAAKQVKVSDTVKAECATYFCCQFFKSFTKSILFALIRRYL